MAKLDRHVWTDAIGFEKFGVRVGIRADSADLMALAAARVPAGATPLASDEVDVLFSLSGGTAARPGVRRYAILYEGVSIILRTLDREALADGLDSAIHLVLAELATEWVFVHAGVVGWRGRAIVLPGATCTGKTTLVAALLRAGAEFYSDDRAVIDRHGLVHPHPRPLSVRESPIARQRPFSAASFGAPTGQRPLPVGMVVLTSFREGAEWEPNAIPAGQAMLSLLEHTSALRSRPHDVLPLLGRTLAGVPAYRGPRGDADVTARQLLALADASPLHMPHTHQRYSSATDAGPGTYVDGATPT
jgi:hypothetical protein